MTKCNKDECVCQAIETSLSMVPTEELEKQIAKELQTPDPDKTIGQILDEQNTTND